MFMIGGVAGPESSAGIAECRFELQYISSRGPAAFLLFVFGFNTTRIGCNPSRIAAGAKDTVLIERPGGDTETDQQWG